MAATKFVIRGTGVLNINQSCAYLKGSLANWTPEITKIKIGSEESAIITINFLTAEEMQPVLLKAGIILEEIPQNLNEVEEINDFLEAKRIITVYNQL